MKYLLLLFLTLCITWGLFPLDGISIGAGPEISGHTRRGVALGGGLSLGIDLNKSFALGLKTSFFHNLDTVSTLEPLLFFRYYLPLKIYGPFVEAEAGAMFAFEDSETYPAFAGGIATGWRFMFGQKQEAKSRFYLEPAMRFGYPHIWGIGIMAGFSIPFGTRKKQSEEQKAEEIKIMEATAELNGLDIIFRPDAADFEGLNEEILQNNSLAFNRIVETLNSFSNYRLVVEGHANPLTPEGPERAAEEKELQKLSEDRANKVVDELVQLGINRGRLLAAGTGGYRPAVDSRDTENTWRNRRVVFYLIKE